MRTTDVDGVGHPSYFDPRPDWNTTQRLARLKTIAPLSPSTKGINLQGLSRQALGIIETRALQEARDASHTSGRLFPTKTRGDDGRAVTVYEGDPRAWMKPYMAEPLHVQFNKHAGQHQEYGRWVPDGSHMETVVNRGMNAGSKP